jgi:hypothetical protein
LETIGDRDEYGDATVPLPGAVGHGLAQGSNRIRRIVDQHGNLHRNPAALHELEEILTSNDIRYKPGQSGVRIRVTAPDLLLAGQPLTVTVNLDDNARHALAITVTDENGRSNDTLQPRVRDSHAEATFDDLPPGAYTVTGTAPASPVTPGQHPRPRRRPHRHLSPATPSLTTHQQGTHVPRCRTSDHSALSLSERKETQGSGRKVKRVEPHLARFRCLARTVLAQPLEMKVQALPSDGSLGEPRRAVPSCKRLPRSSGL